MLNQVHRVILVIIVLFIFVSIIREIVVPEDFGVAGHFRYSNIKEWEQLEPKLVGEYKETCATCHTKQFKEWNEGIHAGISCETCHALVGNVERYPGRLHLSNPSKYKMSKDSRELCLRCHEKLESRPKFIKQVISEQHAPKGKCTTCHNPHNPIKPLLINKYKTNISLITNKCNPCHVGTIYRLQALAKEKDSESILDFLYSVRHPGYSVVSTIEKEEMKKIIEELSERKVEEKRIEKKTGTTKIIENRCNVCHSDTISKLRNSLKIRGFDGTLDFILSDKHPGSFMIKDISRETLKDILNEVK